MRPPLPSQDLDLVLLHATAFWSRFSGARVLLTGGTGFIGMWLLEVLQYANHKLGTEIQIIVLTRNPLLARQRSSQLFNRKDTQLVYGNVCHPLKSVGPLDLCIHAALDVESSLVAMNPLEVFDSIFLGTRHVLELAKEAGASRFLLASSGAVYGVQPVDLERISENYLYAPDSLQPLAAYGNGKRAAEWLTCAYASKDRFEPCIARIFSLVGPGLPLNGSLAAGNFIRDVLGGNQINVEGNGRPLRSYLYMADLCIWLLRIAASGQSCQAYNVGSEIGITIAGLAAEIAKADGSEIPIKIHKPVGDASNLPPRYVPSTRYAREELKLTEYTTLPEALRKTILWSRSATQV